MASFLHQRSFPETPLRENSVPRLAAVPTTLPCGGLNNTLGRLTHNRFSGFALGALFTAVVQSSSVVTGLAILLVQQGSIDVPGAVAIIIGANVGTTVTGLIASIPMRVAAKRTALTNLALNLAGVLLFLPFTHELAAFAPKNSSDPGITVAIAHLVFNLGIAAIALPLVGPLARLLGPRMEMAVR